MRIGINAGDEFTEYIQPLFRCQRPIKLGVSLVGFLKRFKRADHLFHGNSIPCDLYRFYFAVALLRSELAAVYDLVITHIFLLIG